MKRWTFSHNQINQREQQRQILFVKNDPFETELPTVQLCVSPVMSEPVFAP